MKAKKSIRIRAAGQSPSNRTGLDPQIPRVSASLHDQIAVRAFEIYERRIRQGPLDDWLHAEQEILGQQEPEC